MEEEIRAWCPISSAATADTRSRSSCPPGPGGFTPQIALSYASSSGNGPLGAGWSVDLGPTAIERSARNGAPAYDATDGFELGGQRLHGTPAAGPGRYTLERFDGTRVEFVSGGQGYWRASSPDGTRRLYGAEYAAGAGGNDSRLDSVPVSSVAPTTTSCGSQVAGCTALEPIVPGGLPFAWYLDRIEDRNGNVIRVHWTSLGDAGVRYVDQITYGGDGAASRSVTFGYTTRPDVVPGFRSGFRREMAHRLTDVTSWSGSSRVRHYALGYEQSPASGWSRLIRIGERGGDDDAATAFTHQFRYGDGGLAAWSELDTSYALPGSLTFLTGGRDRGVRLLDVNGDGDVDVLYGNAGDRRAYLFTRPQAGAAGTWASGSSAAWAPPGDFVDALGYTGLVFGDFDGDRRPDLIGRRLTDTTGPAQPLTGCPLDVHLEDGSLELSSWSNTGAGWLAAPANNVAPTSVPATLWYDGAAPYATCPVETFPLAITYPGAPFSYDLGTRVLDMNGDGLDDIVAKRKSFATSPFHPNPFLLEAAQEFEATLLNRGSGLQGGSVNASQLVSFDYYYWTGWTDTSYYVSAYAQPRWQFPQDFAGVATSTESWSTTATCGSSSAAGLNPIDVFSGSERSADLNLDGLPDFAVSAVNLRADGTAYPLSPYRVAWLNDGYNWRLADGAVSAWEGSAAPNADFIQVRDAVLTLGYSASGWICFESAASQGGGTDHGWRLVDVNGDEGPDLIGGPSGEVRLWDATAPDGSIWRADDASWALPVSFGALNGQENGTRMADVNGDGMLDFVVAYTDGSGTRVSGAYLNLGEPPDRLVEITGPYGAVTSLGYSPSTDFDTPPQSNPTVDGQIRMPGPVWVLSERTINAGSGQPAITTHFEYREGFFDLRDRAFRGFSDATVIGPPVPHAGGHLARSATRTRFHVSDALAGRPAQIAAYDASASSPAAWVALADQRLTYATASGGSEPPVTVGFDFGASQLSVGDAQQAAFASFRGEVAVNVKVVVG